MSLTGNASRGMDGDHDVSRPIPVNSIRRPGNDRDRRGRRFRVSPQFRPLNRVEIVQVPSGGTGIRVYIGPITREKGSITQEVAAIQIGDVNDGRGGRENHPYRDAAANIWFSRRTPRARHTKCTLSSTTHANRISS